MSEHTPGPWAVRDDGYDYPCPPIDAEAVGRGYYASVANAIQRDPHPQHGGGISRQTAAANARLIAAAPDLLAACRHAMDCLTQPELYDGQDAIDALERAIARVEGEA